MPGPELLATFSVGHTRFAIDAQRVQEVLKDQPMVPVPRTEPSVRGLVNLRGQVITAIGMAERMRPDAVSSHVPAFSVVVRTNDGPVSLLVDEVGEVIDAAGLEADAPPDTLDPALRRMVSGVHQRDEDLLLVLDVDRATEARSHHTNTNEASETEDN